MLLKKEVESVEFRTKEKGWRNSSRNMFLNYKDNTRIMEKYELNEYEQGFHSELILRNCCYECQFAELPHVSDITLEIIGEYENEMRCSMMMVEPVQLSLIV